jgi:hypothetical protein
MAALVKYNEGKTIPGLKAMSRLEEFTTLG